MARNGIIHEATILAQDLRRMRARLVKQLETLKPYDGWNLIKEGRKASHDYYDVIRPGAKRKAYLGSEQNEDVLNVKRLRYAREAVDVIDTDIELLSDLIANYVPPDYKNINGRLPATYQTRIMAAPASSTGSSLIRSAASDAGVLGSGKNGNLLLATGALGSNKAGDYFSVAETIGSDKTGSCFAGIQAIGTVGGRPRKVSPGMLPEALPWMSKLEQEKAKYPLYNPEQLKHPAMDGTYMRSKSEVIIANILFQADIPYVYEAPLFVNGKNILPDFTILSLIDLEIVIIIEHQGMVFVDEYVAKFIRSLKTYLQTDWIPNENLFFTFDDARETINTRQVISILRKHIKPSIS